MGKRHQTKGKKEKLSNKNVLSEASIKALEMVEQRRERLTLLVEQARIRSSRLKKVKQGSVQEMGLISGGRRAELQRLYNKQDIDNSEKMI